MAEPGSTNEFGEYRWWLHVWGLDDHNERHFPGVYPWPFAERTIDAEKLAAYMHIGQMRNWPGSWPRFKSQWQELCGRGNVNAMITMTVDMGVTMHNIGPAIAWKLAPGNGTQHIKDLLTRDKMASYLIPEVFIKCICSK